MTKDDLHAKFKVANVLRLSDKVSNLIDTRTDLSHESITHAVTLYQFGSQQSLTETLVFYENNWAFQEDSKSTIKQISARLGFDRARPNFTTVYINQGFSSFLKELKQTSDFADCVRIFSFSKKGADYTKINSILDDLGSAISPPPQDSPKPYLVYAEMSNKIHVGLATHPENILKDPIIDTMLEIKNKYDLQKYNAGCAKSLLNR